jgi:hypothetical protein
MYAYVAAARAARRRAKAGTPLELDDDLRQLFVDADAGLEAVAHVLGTYGVVAVRGVMAPDEADAAARALIDTVTTLSDGVKADDLSTWTRERLLPQVAPGVFAAGVGNSAAAWAVRTHAAVQAVFRRAYGVPEGTPMVCSPEMVHVRPPVKPWHDPAATDWTHMDNHGAWEKCLQGQVVLTATSACPLVSPGSHLVCPQVVAFRRSAPGIDINGNPAHRAHVRALVEGVGGRLQVPLVTPPGTVILWVSSMLHSARRALEDAPPAWRCVVYTAWQPRHNVAPAVLAGLQEAFARNGVTRHTGHAFPVRTLASYGDIAWTARVVELYHCVVTAGSWALTPQCACALTPTMRAALGMEREDGD